MEFYYNARLCISLSYRGRYNRSRNLLLLYTKMLSQKTYQRWQEGIKGRGGPKVRAASGKHVQGQGMYSMFRVFCVDVREAFYTRGIHFDMRRSSRIWKSWRITPKNRTRPRASRAKLNSESCSTRYGIAISRIMIIILSVSTVK